MKMPTEMPRLKGFRFPREIISFAVWAYHRFALSTTDVEDLLAAHDQIDTVFRLRRYRLFAVSYHHARSDAFDLWKDYALEMTARSVH